MTTLKSAEQVVSQLTADELSEFRKWFTEFDARAWDAQIERDAANGKLDSFADEALKEYNAGKATEI